MSQRRLKDTANDLDRIAGMLRREAVRRLREDEGKTFAQIGQELGVSRARAQQLWAAVQAEQEEQPA